MPFLVKSASLYDKNKARRSALRFYAFVAAAIGGLGLVIHLVDRHLALAPWAEQERQLVETASRDLYRQFGDSLSDLLILASHGEWLAKDLDSHRALAGAFTRIAHVLPRYHQLRLIDGSGMEVVRVETDDGQTVAVPDDELQNKAQRYYFIEGMRLAPGDVYVSPMDLNVEHGEIERPLRPMIRLVTPATDGAGKMQGVLVANLSADILLRSVALHAQLSRASLMLLNNRSYWLYSEKAGDAWGFQLAHGRRFADAHADAWSRIQQSPAGQFRNAQGLYTYQTVRDVLVPMHSANGEPLPTVPERRIVNPPQWHMVSFADRTLLLAEVYARGKVILAVALLALLLLVPVSRAWGVREAQHAFASERIRTYATIIERSNELVYVVSQAGEILFANPAVERCYGFSQEEMVGKRPSIVKSGRHPQEFYRLLWQTIGAGEIFEGIFVNRRKNGSLFYEAKRIVPIRLSDSGETVFVSMGEDLTATIEEKRHDIRSTYRVSTRIQHHFNNLLNGIMGYLQVALIKLRASNGGDAEEILKRSLASAVQAQEFVSRIGRGGSRGSANLYPVDVVALADRVVASLQAQMPKGIGLSLFAGDGLPRIQGNVGPLEVALGALVENARDAITGEGHVRVELSLMTPVDEICINCGEPVHGERLVIAVSDDGTGIREEHLKEIFDPFYSTKESAKLVDKTPGLGLTIVRSIVHMHGGHVLLDTEEGKGTRVRLLIPLTQDG
jgi:PAS domain S-box-containing protein